jgi:hypothetical protein
VISTPTTSLDLNVALARFGAIDLWAQAEVPSTLRADTPTLVVERKA